MLAMGGGPTTSSSIPFDVRAFAHGATGSHRDELGLAEYQTRALPPDTLRNLQHLRHLESATMRYLRQVLVTPTHKDARITAFLTTWAFEKYWMADGLAAILEHHGWSPNSTQAQTPAPPADRWRRLQDRFAPIGRSLVDNAVGDDIIAVHMAVGAIDEWIMHAAYRRVAELDDHPRLRRTVATFVEIKTRHLEFFEAEARERLAGSQRARRLTRSRLPRASWPPHARRRPGSADAGFFGHLFAATPVVVNQLDRQIRTLPGLESLALVRATVAASTMPRRSTPTTAGRHRSTPFPYRSDT